MNMIAFEITNDMVVQYFYISRITFAITYLLSVFADRYRNTLKSASTTFEETMIIWFIGTFIPVLSNVVMVILAVKTYKQLKAHINQRGDVYLVDSTKREGFNKSYHDAVMTPVKLGFNVSSALVQVTTVTEGNGGWTGPVEKAAIIQMTNDEFVEAKLIGELNVRDGGVL